MAVDVGMAVLVLVEVLVTVGVLVAGPGVLVDVGVPGGPGE